MTKQSKRKEENEFYFGPPLKQSFERNSREIQRSYEVNSDEADPDDHELAFLVYKVKKYSQEASTEDNFTYAIKSIKDKVNKELLAYQKHKMYKENVKKEKKEQSEEKTTKKRPKNTNVVYLLPLPPAATPAPPTGKSGYILNQQSVQPAYTLNQWHQQQTNQIAAVPQQQYSQPSQQAPVAYGQGHSGSVHGQGQQRYPQYYEHPRQKSSSRPSAPKQSSLTLKVR